MFVFSEATPEEADEMLPGSTRPIHGDSAARDSETQENAGSAEKHTETEFDAPTVSDDSVESSSADEDVFSSQTIEEKKSDVHPKEEL